jgi:hypothetical protein
MMMVRQDEPAARRRESPTRLNLLLSCGQGQEDPAVEQLPRLLAPMGIHAGPRVLQLLRRLEQPPPTVVIRPRQPVARDSARGLAAALREGAFAVLDRPIHLEMMLEVMRRILRRHYADVWPMS